MLKLTAVLLLASFSSLAADPWDKLKNLKTGSDLKIYKTAGGEPITAKSADVTETKVVVIIKNEETAIRKSEIARIDYQPPAGKHTKSKDYTVTEDSASMSIGSSSNREGWQTIYQRPPTK
jgi:hypothetical protein